MLIDSLENKQKILKHFLNDCIFDGWSVKALEEAFRKSEIDIKFLPFIFENGILDVADFFVREIDEQMIQATKDLDFTQMKIRDKIKTLVQARLKINAEFKPQIKQLVSFYLNPKYTRYALTNAYKTADLMWKIAGDNSTDYNYYTKRITLAKIYARVLYSFANDDSENHQKTLDILDREIEKVIQFATFKFKIRNRLNQTSGVFKKISQIKENLSSDPKSFIKNLPFFRLYK